MTNSRVAIAVAIAFPLVACSVDDATGERVLTGAAAGAAGGAAVGLLHGGVVSRAITGALAGSAGAIVIDQIDKAKRD